MTGLPELWCRFCKELTKQVVSEVNPHHRTCITCWRRQKDGVRIEITDGERFSEQAPRRDTRPPTLPPPPMIPAVDYVERLEFNDVLRRIETIERVLAAQSNQLSGVAALTTLYK